MDNKENADPRKNAFNQSPGAGKRKRASEKESSYRAPLKDITDMPGIAPTFALQPPSFEIAQDDPLTVARATTSGGGAAAAGGDGGAAASPSGTKGRSSKGVSKGKHQQGGGESSCRGKSNGGSSTNGNKKRGLGGGNSHNQSHSMTGGSSFMRPIR